MTEACDGFNTLSGTRCRQNKSLKNLNMCFSAAVTKVNSLNNTTKLLQCLISLIMIGNANIVHTQRVFLLASAACLTGIYNEETTNYVFISAVTCKQVASVVKQCDRSRSDKNSTSSVSNIAANAAASIQPYRGTI